MPRAFNSSMWNTPTCIISNNGFLVVLQFFFMEYAANWESDFQERQTPHDMDWTEGKVKVILKPPIPIPR